MKTYQLQLPVRQLCNWLKIPHSVYYYLPKDGKPGAKPSTHTLKSDGALVPNNEVVNTIRAELNQEFVCYGYQNMTAVLREQNFIINHKKVYRLMNESHLLLGKVIRTGKSNQSKCVKACSRGDSRSGTTVWPADPMA